VTASKLAMLAAELAAGREQVGGATVLVTFGVFVCVCVCVCVNVVSDKRRCCMCVCGLRTGRWCDCACDVHLCSLHYAHKNLTINMQLHTLQLQTCNFTFSNFTPYRRMSRLPRCAPRRVL
jgi:hypothetical protein